ncbi:hypothetical protein LHK12_02315 [Providencia rettgeri]|nr:hypothetical protein [Providencia rettgeri]
MNKQKQRKPFIRSAIFIAIIAVAGVSWYFYHQEKQLDTQSTGTVAKPNSQRSAMDRPPRVLALCSLQLLNKKSFRDFYQA